jgi:hypothetical protein
VAQTIWSGVLAPTLLIGLAGAAAAANSGTTHPAPLTINSALGGEILGYDVDQNGTEGVMSEVVQLGNLINDIAIETFDQTTGKVRIVKEIKNNYGDFVTLGVVGTSVGLVEFEHSQSGGGVTKRTYDTLNPLGNNKITGRWTPPFNKNHIIIGVSESQGFSTTAVLAFNNGTPGRSGTFVFGSNVADNTFGPLVQLKNLTFSEGYGPHVAMDTATGDAIAASAEGDTAAQIATIDLANATVSEFTGVGLGNVQGLGVDSADGIACTTTEDDNVEFYDLATQTGFAEQIPGATSVFQSGTNVQFDAVNSLFLVAQPVSTQGGGTSSVLEYDTNGNFITSVNGLDIAGGLVIGPGIAFNPNTRTGYVQSSTNTLEAFSY